MIHSRNLLLPALIAVTAVTGFAQPNRIRTRIDATHRVTLRGRVHPLANVNNDAGAVSSTYRLNLTLLLKPSADQQTSLDQLTQQQQSPGSTNFHKWLSPEQYADRFGASTADVTQMVQWLQAQGFTVDAPSRGRTFLTFSGTSGQVQNAFGVTIHRYNVNGVSHYANTGDPQIPAAMSDLVAGIRGLNDFHPRPQFRKRANPQLTFQGEHVMAPADFASIYNITPLYNAGINGTGQSIAIVGQSALYQSGADITSFWSRFGITTAKLTQKLVNSRLNPGVVAGDVDEASLDVEWASAVARNATIVFVYSNDVWTSAQYVVDNNVAPVLSMSYGSCEMFDLVDLPTFRQMVQQANAEGITWVAASGDQGATDCDYGADVAEGGLAVDAPGSIPEVTSMGGTMFNEGGGNYWGNTGNASGYIPETAWNDSSVAGTILAGGGGASVFFPQPSWQTAYGAPADGWRHVPDVSFNSSVYHDPYFVISTGISEPVGGTSAATPTMAGVVALLNQYLVANNIQSQAGLGNINPILYPLSQTPGIFHDITAGNNNSPCAFGSPQCNNGTEGYSAVPGYDSATGMGSMDVTALVHAWSTAIPTGSLVVPSIDQNPVYQTSAGKWSFNLSLTEEAGIPTTLTDFTINGTSYASQIQSLFGTKSIGARQTIATSYTLSLSNFPANETFGFSGVDANNTPWTTALTVPFQGPQTNLKIGGVSNAATGQQVYAPGMIMSVYGTGLGTLSQAASTIPLPQYMAGTEAFINGIQVPLYYVGANQVNLQIPYETPNGIASLSIYNPYQTVNYTFTVSSVGPGIFMFPDGSVNPSNTAKVGDPVTLFITGDGKVSPSLPDGTTPPSSTPYSALPKPRATVSMTVAGIPVSTTSPVWFVGIPSGLVGVTQINFTIPAGVPTGRQPVVVTVGTTQTPPAYITIQ